MGMDIDDCIFMPITAAFNLTGTSKVSKITVRIPNPKDVDKGASDTRRILLSELDRTDFTLSTEGESLDMFKDIMSIMELITFVIAGISLLVGGIGIMNIMLVTVTERTREIGIRKAVGATFANILVQFMSESIIVAISGAIVGIIASLSILALLSPFISFPLKASITSIIVAFSFTTLVGVFFGTYPAIKAARIDPILALRYE